MEIIKASKKKAKIKLSLAGPPGSGKSYSALLLAFGLCNDWSKICVVDTENGSASLYSHLGPFNVIDLKPPYTPDRFIEAIKLAESVSEVIVLDSAAAEWSGSGGCLEIHEKETAKMKVPNSFMAWATVSRLHHQFIDAILHSGCHVISCLRSKVEYTLTEKNGKQVPVKLGMAPETRNGFEFEVSISLELSQDHFARVSKDRTGLFEGKEPFLITSDTGKLISDWCNEGDDLEVEVLKSKITSASTVPELLTLFKENPLYQDLLLPLFSKRRSELEPNASVTPLSDQNSNGHEYAI